MPRLSGGWDRNLIACIALAFIAVSAAGIHSRDHPIVFKPGEDTACANGRFARADSEIYFSLDARAGQHLRVNIVSLTPKLVTAGVVIYPSGKQDGGPGGVVFDSELTETGRYRIRVTQRQREVPGRFKVEVRLAPSPH